MISEESAPPEMPRGVDASCRCCYRSERVAGGERRVLIEGGARRADDPAREAFAVLAAAARGEWTVAGACPACGQPMVVPPGALPPVRFEIETRAGKLLLDEGCGLYLPGHSERATPERAERWLEGVLPPRIRPEDGRMTPFQGALLLLMMTPLLVWMGAILFVVVFLYRLELPVIP